jgi:hypothetical protein
MPIYKCGNKKYRIGTGKCMYKSRASAERAYAAYRAASHAEVRTEYISFVVQKLRSLKEKKEKTL